MAPSPGPFSFPYLYSLAPTGMLLKRKVAKLEASLGQTESELAQAKVELLRPPAAQAVPTPAPPPGT